MAKVTVYSDTSTKVTVNQRRSATVRSMGVSGGAEVLSQLHDVEMTNAENGNVLVYDASRGKFVLQELPNIDGGTF